MPDTTAPRTAAPTAATTGREDDVQAFRRFVAQSRWCFARTYMESYPHEYTLQAWGEGEAFPEAIACIERWGIVESFWGAKRKYFYIDERKYWHMGDAASERTEQQPTLINRTWLDVTRYRDAARSLGYDEEGVNHLAVRWEALLEKAKRGR